MSEKIKIPNDRKIYACWSAVSNDVEHLMVRADMVFLNLIYKDESGITRFRRIRGTKETHKSTQCLVWTAERRVRITNGQRKGKIVDPCDVQEEESFVESGCSKILQKGKRPFEFRDNHSSDQDMWSLASFVADAVDVDKLPLPDLYLTCSIEEENIHARNNGAAQSYIKALSGYSGEISLTDNLRRFRKQIATDAGKDRVAYPYDVVVGKGVVAACTDSSDMCLGEWYALDKDVKSVKSKHGIRVDIGDLLK